MTPQTLPYQLVVIFHLPNGLSEVYGMFDTEEEARGYADSVSIDLPEGTTAEFQLLMPK